MTTSCQTEYKLGLNISGSAHLAISFQACLRRSWQNTRSRSRSSTAFQWALIACSGTLSRCEKQVETWQKSELTDVTAKVVIYEAFVEGRLEGPKHVVKTKELT